MKLSLRTADTTGLKDDMVNGTSDVTEEKTIRGEIKTQKTPDRSGK